MITIKINDMIQSIKWFYRFYKKTGEIVAIKMIDLDGVSIIHSIINILLLLNFMEISILHHYTKKLKFK
jgi:hypothetical protein